jgi:hypothetical protein
MPPNTREYRSPEAVRFEWENWRNKDARYEASTADDLYALAVSIYRLLTGEYPPPGMPPEAREDSPQAPPPVRVSPQALNPRVVRELVELVERVLAEDPQARGSARELAQAADSAAEHARPEADVPLFDVHAAAVAAPGWARFEAQVDRSAAEAPEARPARVSAVPQPRPGALKAAFAAATAFAIMALCQGGDEPCEQAHEVAWVEAEDTEQAPDGGTKGLGEEVLSARVDSQETPVPSLSAITQVIPDKPLPGQRRAPCPHSAEVEINGGCWKRQPDIEPPCNRGDYYLWRGACYLPVMKRTREPTTQEP